MVELLPALGGSEQNDDIKESRRICVFVRVLYSALCRHVECPVSLGDFIAAVLPALKSLRGMFPFPVVRSCRALLQLKPEDWEENLLIAADELAKLQKEGLVGVVSDKVMNGLKALVDLSTASLIDHQGNERLGALYVCGSAYSAYNPVPWASQ